MKIKQVDAQHENHWIKNIMRNAQQAKCVSGRATTYNVICGTDNPMSPVFKCQVQGQHLVQSDLQQGAWTLFLYRRTVCCNTLQEENMNKVIFQKDEAPPHWAMLSS